MRPRRALRLQPVQLDGAVVILYGLIEFTKVVEAKPQGVISAHHFRVQFGDFLQTGDGGSVIPSVVIQTAEPVQEKRILRLRPGKPLQFRASPISPVEFDVGHSQGEPVSIVERDDGLSRFSIFVFSSTAALLWGTSFSSSAISASAWSYFFCSRRIVLMAR